MLVPSYTPNWSARALCVRPVAPTLRPLPKRPVPKPLHDVPSAIRVTSKWVKPDKAERQARREFIPAHEPYAEDDTRHWQEPERWIEQPYIEPPMIVGDTEWNALKPITGRAHGEAFYMAWGTDDQPRFCDAPTPVLAPKFDTSPLVAASQRKEADLLLKLKSDCLQSPAPVVAARPDPLPIPIDQWELEHQARLAANREHIKHIARDYAAIVRARDAQAVPQ